MQVAPLIEAESCGGITSCCAEARRVSGASARQRGNASAFLKPGTGARTRPAREPGRGEAGKYGKCCAGKQLPERLRGRSGPIGTGPGRFPGFVRYRALRDTWVGWGRWRRPREVWESLRRRRRLICRMDVRRRCGPAPGNPPRPGGSSEHGREDGAGFRGSRRGSIPFGEKTSPPFRPEA